MSLDVFYFVEKHSVAITTVTTIILVFITAFYAYELKQQNSIAIRPYATQKLSHQNDKDEEGHTKMYLFIYIKNIGRGPLINPTIKLTEPDEIIIQKNIVLAIGDEKRIKLGEIEKYQKYDELVINLNYEDIYGKKCEQDFKSETHINEPLRV